MKQSQVGSTWNVVPGSFLRIGPTAELRVNFPTLVFRHGLGLSGQYSYLPALSGTTAHASLLNLAAALTLMENSSTHQKISLTGAYTRGGLDLTKQDLNIFTLVLSVLF